uniref:Uncharacterized protein n=1 Tax=Romanomermis culicivorax TaxID=13658 RepID=A0A915JGR2_ROMCU
MVTVISLDQLLQKNLCAVAGAEIALAVAVGKRQIYWAVAPNFADGGQLKVCGRDSGPVIRLCCGDGQNRHRKAAETLVAAFLGWLG